MPSRPMSWRKEGKKRRDSHILKGPGVRLDELGQSVEKAGAKRGEKGKEHKPFTVWFLERAESGRIDS